MSGKAYALVIFFFIGVSWTFANPAVPHEGNQDAPACPLVAGCTTQDQCHEGPTGCSCGITRPSELSACHWPHVSEMGMLCGRVGFTPDCSCAPSHDNSTDGDMGSNVCPTVFGCTPASMAQCSWGTHGFECDTNDPTFNEVCHWPVSTTGCQAIPGVPDCACPPANGMEHGHTQECPIVQGCTQWTHGCTAGNGHQCDTSNPGNLMPCHWPASTTGCSAVAGVEDCTCDPAPGSAYLPSCPAHFGCTATSTEQCSWGPMGYECNTSNPSGSLDVCHWPASWSGTCQPIPGVPDCSCDPVSHHNDHNGYGR